jgi:DNA polymerase epsilon subunit 3
MAEESSIATAPAAEEVELRKANDDVYSTKQQDKAASGPDGIDQYELAKTQVTKVAKSAISDDHGVQLRKEVVLGLIKASTVFISYLSAAALEKTQEAGNKTISAQHVLAAFKEMDFPEQYYAQLKKDYNEKVKAELEKARANGEKMPETDGTVDQPATMETEQTGDASLAGAGEESLAVGEETLAAVDPRDMDSEEDEDEDAN